MLWALCAFSLALSGFSCWLAVSAARLSASGAPTSWNIRLAELRQELVEVQDLLEQMQMTLKKRSARTANSARWSGEASEPDPTKDPEAWKRWANAGGLRQYLKGK